MTDDWDTVRCGACDLEARHWWWVRMDSGMVERVFCDAHMGSNLSSDEIAFGDRIVYGSNAGEL